MTTLLLAVAAGWLGAGASAATDLRIAHEPVRCVLAERYPLLDACVEPALRVARVRAFFRAEGASEWHYVDLGAVGTCYRGALPPPRAATRALRYYVVASDVLSGEVRTPEAVAEVVGEEKACRSGPLGPFLSSASVVVGGRGLPAGFVGGPGGGSPGKKVVAAVLGGGAVGAGALLASRGGGSAGTSATGGLSPVVDATTTTLPAPPATTTTTTRPASTPTTPTTTTTTRPASTTTTTLAASGCALDSAVPTVSIQSPRDGADVGASVAVSVDARDPGPVSNGMKQVRLHAQEVGGTRVVAIGTLSGAGPSYATTWTLPSCNGSQDRWDLTAEATDNCGRSASDTVRVRRKPSACGYYELQAQSQPSRVSWTSELSVADGRGQLIANGSDAVFTPERRAQLPLAARPGANRVEAVLVQAAGTPGLWRFSVASGSLKPGSLRALAGEVASLDGDGIVFRMRGRPGERVVFAYQLE